MVRPLETNCPLIQAEYGRSSLTHLRIEIGQLYFSVRQFLSYPPDHLCCPELSLNLAEWLDKPGINTGGFANLAQIGLPPQSCAELLLPSVW